jgi:ligand-binding sensor domain-containing protein
MRILITLAFSFLQSMLFAQSGSWTAFYPQIPVNCMAARGNTILAGTAGSGIISFDTLGNRTFFHTTNSGLPADTIRLLAIDLTGNWWLYHTGAISRFDGTNSQSWSISAQIGLPANTTVRMLKVAPDNSLYAATSDGVAIFQNGTWSILNASNSGLPNNSITDVAFSPNGKRYYGTIGGGVAEQDGAIWTIYNASNTGIAGFNNVLSLAVTSDNTLWVVNGLNGIGIRLVRFASGVWTAFSAAAIGIIGSSTPFYRLTTDDTGRLCLMTSKTASFLEQDIWAHYYYDEIGCRATNTIPAVVDGSGAFSFWSDCDLLRFHHDAWSNIVSGLPGQSYGIMYDGIAEDIEGNFWMAQSDGSYISRVSGNTWDKFYPKQFGASDNWVFTIQPDLDGSVWFGLDSAQILHYANDTWAFIDTCQVHFPAHFVVNSAEAPNGDRWFAFIPNSSAANYSGLALLTASGQWQFFIPGQPNFPVSPFGYYRKILIEANGTAWFPSGGIGNKGIYRYNGVSWDSINVNNSALPSNEVYFLAQAPDNAIWAATANGLARYDGQIWTVLNTSNSDIPSNRVGRVAFDKAGGMYIGFVPEPPGSSNARVAEYRNGIWTDLVPPFPNWYSQVIEPDAFIVDSQNRLWFAKSVDPRSMVYRYDPMLVNTQEPNGEQSLLFTIMPNPTSGAVFLQLKEPVQGDFLISITNASGQKVYERQTALTADTQLSLDFGGLPAGVYWLSLQGTDGTWEVLKVVRQ